MNQRWWYLVGVFQWFFQWFQQCFVVVVVVFDRVDVVIRVFQGNLVYLRGHQKRNQKKMMMLMNVYC